MARNLFGEPNKCAFLRSKNCALNKLGNAEVGPAYDSKETVEVMVPCR